MEINKYEDIINMPHHKSKKRPQMSNYDRAAQFSPFAALTGHDAAIRETARLTERKRELTEEEKSIISEKLRYLHEVYNYDADIGITYFKKDEDKEGGEYITKRCRITKIDENERVIYTSSCGVIAIENLLDIDGDIFERGISGEHGN